LFQEGGNHLRRLRITKGVACQTEEGKGYLADVVNRRACSGTCSCDERGGSARSARFPS